MRNPFQLVLLLFVALSCFGATASLAESTEIEKATDTKAKPNIILINLDDADADMLSPETMAVYFPNLKRFADEGIRFTNFHVTTPLCGPSRAALFRGQYASNNKIRSNNPFVSRSNGFDGGMVMYGRHGHHENDVSAWMKKAGYRTMMIGKYLHGDLADIVPTGWDDFYSSRGANYFGTARFTNEKNPAGRGYVEDITTYRTTREADEALTLIDNHVARQKDPQKDPRSNDDNGQPFFLYLAPLAPHHHTPHDPNGMVERKYLDLWPETLMPLHADYLEADFSDKSTAIRDLPMMNERQIERLKTSYRNRMLSMKSVDDMFARLSEKLIEYGLLDSTYIILTSDNGFSNGHHRMIGKGDSFHRSSLVPTYVIGPNIVAGTEADHLLAHIDLAPSIVELGGGGVPPDVDGISFVPLLTRSKEIEPADWRDAILIENWESRTLQNKDFNTASIALRMRDSVYVEWAHGTPEYYDLKKDPWQVDNSFAELSSEQVSEYSARLKKLRSQDQKPLTTISHPFALSGIQDRGKPMTGMAEADYGVKAVDVSIRRLRDSLFWNGDGWQFALTTLPATLSNPGQVLTTWELEQDIQSQFADDLFEVSAKATDLKDHVDPKTGWSLFQLDHTPPVSTIILPVADLEIQDRFHVKGTTDDQSVVSHVLMVIRDKTSKKYWNSKTWQDEWTTINLPVRSNGRFGISLNDFHGNFYVSVRAVDLSGNVQKQPTSIIVSVLNPAFMNDEPESTDKD